MKYINQFINEKLIINKETKIDKLENKEYIISAKNWIRSRVAIIIDIIKNYKNKNRKSFSKNQIKFMNDLSIKLKTYWTSHQDVENDPELIKLLNGEAPEHKNLKLIYDALIWTLDNDDSCTGPRRKKLENILNELKPYEEEIKELEY